MTSCDIKINGIKSGVLTAILKYESIEYKINQPTNKVYCRHYLCQFYLDDTYPTKN